MAIIVNGRKIAKRVLMRLRKVVRQRRLKLSLGIVLVGIDAATQSFIRQKTRAAREIGVAVSFYQLPQTASFARLKDTIKIAVKKHSGVIVQLPLPSGLKRRTQEILDLIPEAKDPDVLSTAAWAQFLTKDKPLPAVVGAIKEIFQIYKVNPKGKNTAVVGFGLLVGKPVSYWLAQQGAKVRTIDIGTKNKKVILKKSDIIISGVGKPRLIRASDIKRGAVVIDAGTSEAKGKLVGDIDPAVAKKTKLFCPVPGGIGPITVAVLLKNLVDFHNFPRRSA